MTVMAPGMFASTIEKTVAKAHAYMQLIDLVYQSDLVPLNYRGTKVQGSWRDYPEAKVKANLLAAGLLGDGMGVDPFTAWSNIYPTQAGKLGLAADFKLSLCQAAGHQVEVLVRTPKECTVRGRRKGSDKWVEVTITDADAKAAGWTRNPVYGTPLGMSDMLYHRATGRICDMVGADILHGLVTVDDLDDVPTDPAGASTEREIEGYVAEAERGYDLQPGDKIRSSMIGKLLAEQQQHVTSSPAVAIPPDSALGELVEHTRRQRLSAQLAVEAEEAEAVADAEESIADDPATWPEAAVKAVEDGLGGEVIVVEEDPGLDPGTWNVINMMFRNIHKIKGVGQSEARLRVIRQVTGRDDIERGSQMTTWEGEMVKRYLADSDPDDVREVADWQSHEEETPQDDQ